ncbi:MAG: MBOAT family protein [Lachnospiraceae bacterium]|nr:MBOAT family protein [Lachnospiraceae bacterium]
MLFNTPQYIRFLPIVVLIYYCLPKKVRYIWLLCVSYYFYMRWNPLYITLLFSCTLLTFVSGRILERFNQSSGSKNIENAADHDEIIIQIRKKKKVCLVVCILLNLGILVYFKYFNFGIMCLNRLLHIFRMNEIDRSFDILLPVGISFYTLQALGYLIDVYRGDIYAEKNFLKYALFVSFFPQLVAGPIERSKNLLVQLQKQHPFQYDNLRKGWLLVLYGLFLKMVIADRAAIIVDTVYNSESYQGFYIVIATFFFAIQIYCDFYGYSTIARGSALLMGIRLMDNFAAPYYSKSVKEFWRRWHISLSGWFRDYLYIPLGGNKKGRIRKESNLFTVFAISGLWHGAAVSFIFWGILNGVYQIVGDWFHDVKHFISRQRSTILQKLNLENTDIDKNMVETFSKKAFQTIGTFCLITFSWLFFRAGDMRTACRMIVNIFRVNNWTIFFDGSLYDLGVASNYMFVLIMSIFILFIVDYQKYKGRDVSAWLLKQGWLLRVPIYMFFIFTILLYGCYGEIYDIQQFIYFQF